MSVTVTVTGTKLDELPIDEALMRDVGLLAERLIRTRTEQMRDVNGAPLQPLSPGYAKAKAEAGLLPVPNLTVSGRMLNDMAVMDVTPRSVSIGFLSSGGTALRTGRRRKGVPTASTFIQRSRSVGAADKAFYHNETGAGRSGVVREFFALSPSDEDAIEAAIDAHLERVLES